MPDAEQTKADASQAGLLAGLDRSMSHGPGMVRIGPLLLWVACMFVVGLARDWDARTLPYLYGLQCVLTTAMLWRYRKHLPEMTLWFHWTVIPSAVFLVVGWIFLGWLMGGQLSERIVWLKDGMPIDHALNSKGEPHYFQTMSGEYPVTYQVSIFLRLLGMSLIVPFVEEIFNRSLCLRAMHSAKKTKIAFLQVLHDMPGLGDVLMHKPAVRAAAQQEPMFTKQFYETPLGKVSVFGIAASTFIFMLNHVPRDYVGCIICGVLWCLMVKWTNGESRKRKLGLGPVIWSHGLTNALLWWYTIASGDWQFL